MHYILISDKDVKVMNKSIIFKSNKPKLPCILVIDGRETLFNLVPNLG